MSQENPVTSTDHSAPAELPLTLKRSKDGSYPDVAEERQRLRDGENEAPRIALCLSGGGIRSATFSLGVIQALAKLEWFERFTYLSTVSGGGYIGSWLTSWLRRKGLAQVQKELAQGSASGEPEEIRQLRSGSNYLSPTTGLSGDALALVATFVRNLLINWIMIIPLLIAATVLPMINAGIVDDVIAHRARWESWQYVAFWGALLCALIGLGYTASDLPNGTTRQTIRNYFLRFAFAPVFVGCYLLSLALANDQLVETLNEQYQGMVPPAIAIPRQYLYAVVGAALHCVGIWLGRLAIQERRYHQPLNSRDFKGEIGTRIPAPYKVTGVAIFSGAIAGYAVYWVVQLANSAHASIAAAGYESAWSAIYATVAVPFLLLCYALGSVLYLALLRRNSDEGAREWWGRAGGVWLLTALLWVLAHVVCIWLPALLSKWGAIATGGVGTLGGVLVAIAGYYSSHDATSKQGSDTSVLESLNIRVLDLIACGFIIALFVTCALLLVQSSTDLDLDKNPGGVFAAYMGGVHRFPLERAGIALLCVAVSYCFAWFAGVNAFSMHSMYGNRLARAYLGATRSSAPRKGEEATGQQRRPHAFTGFDPDDDVAMADVDPKKSNKLFHVVNIALNIMRASGNHLEWQERKAASFTVTPFLTGSQVTGYCSTRSIGGRGATEVKQDPDPAQVAAGVAPAAPYKVVPGITLGRAMTISGAAASPSMGYHSSKLIAIVMAFFNIRLGWWMPNPSRLEAAAGDEKKLARLQQAFVHTEPSFPLYSLLSEMFGNTTDASKSIYLSDGGHFENLGLYEMVRRECLEIVAVDAGCDPDYEFDDLERAIRIIRNDLGVEIEFPYGLPTAAEIERTGRPFTVGHIKYRSGQLGRLLYIKPGLSGSEPVDVARYASRARENGEPFPHQSTADQFFDEPQFESYRALGRHSLRKLVDAAVPTVAAVDKMFADEKVASKDAAKGGIDRAGAPAARLAGEGKNGGLREALSGLFSWDKLPGLLATVLGIGAGAATFARPDAPASPAPDTHQQVPDNPLPGKPGSDQPVVGDLPDPDDRWNISMHVLPPGNDAGGQPRRTKNAMQFLGFSEGRVCEAGAKGCNDGAAISSAGFETLDALDRQLAKCAANAPEPLRFTLRGFTSTSEFTQSVLRTDGSAVRERHPDSDAMNLDLADRRAVVIAASLRRSMALNANQGAKATILWNAELDRRDKPAVAQRLAAMRKRAYIDRGRTSSGTTPVGEYDREAGSRNRRVDIDFQSMGTCDMADLDEAILDGAPREMQIAATSGSPGS